MRWSTSPLAAHDFVLDVATKGERAELRMRASRDPEQRPHHSGRAGVVLQRLAANLFWGLVGGRWPRPLEAALARARARHHDNDCGQHCASSSAKYERQRNAQMTAATTLDFCVCAVMRGSYAAARFRRCWPFREISRRLGQCLSVFGQVRAMLAEPPGDVHQRRSNKLYEFRSESGEKSKSRPLWRCGVGWTLVGSASCAETGPVPAFDGHQS